VTFECTVVLPRIKDKLQAQVLSVTKGGIHAKVEYQLDEPICVYVIRDGYVQANQIRQFNEVKPGFNITVEVVDLEYEKNDAHITVEGRLLSPKTATLVNGDVGAKSQL